MNQISANSWFRKSLLTFAGYKASKIGVGKRWRLRAAVISSNILIACFSSSASALNDGLYQQIDGLGVKLGMTLSEARALVESQGGAVKWSMPPNYVTRATASPPHGWMTYFEYTASLVPQQAAEKGPDGFIVPKRVRTPDRMSEVKPDNDVSVVKLYVYPKTKGRATDPDNLVIYAIRAGLGARQTQGIKLEDFLSHLNGKYGPVREVIWGGRQPFFVLLPDVSTGQNYSLADLLDNKTNQGTRTAKSCGSLGDQVLAVVGSPLPPASLHRYSHFSDFIDKNPRLGPGTYSLWEKCGEVTRIKATLPSRPSDDTTVQGLGILRYSLKHYQAAVVSFSECSKRGIASCISSR